jgi:hypothetical protein
MPFDERHFLWPFTGNLKILLTVHRLFFAVSFGWRMFTEPNLHRMKSITYKENSLKGRLLCSVFGHKFATTRHITDHFKEFECRVCKMQVTSDVTGRKISLTQEHREINEALISLYQKRHSHI